MSIIDERAVAHVRSNLAATPRRLMMTRCANRTIHSMFKVIEVRGANKGSEVVHCHGGRGELAKPFHLTSNVFDGETTTKRRAKAPVQTRTARFRTQATSNLTCLAPAALSRCKSYPNPNVSFVNEARITD
ncbi:hypothetical protein GI582_08750 [Sulfitobacter sp. BDSS02]|nr:hypothetical protein [Sulfitobacter sp. BDSS02]MBR9850622.1 hypothetical protein [Paracoccaceae bacterium]